MNKISIIVPMYNVEQYITKCINSVYSQNLCESDFEIVLVNDNSPDNSLAVATALTKNKSNAVIISQENKGLGGARNTGIINATGKYLLFLDSDDWLLPDVLGQLIGAAIEDDLDVLEFAAQGINAKGEILYHIQNKSEVYLSGYDYYNSVRYMNSACNKLYKRSFLLENKLLLLEKIYIEDFEFNTRVLLNAKRLKATNHLVSQFLQSENSITRTSDASKKLKMIEDIIQVIKITDALYKKEVHSDSSKRFFLERLNFLVATLFYQLIKNKASHQEMLNLKLALIEDDIFYFNHKIFDAKKNILRIMLLKNLWTYKWLQLVLQ